MSADNDIHIKEEVEAMAKDRVPQTGYPWARYTRARYPRARYPQARCTQVGSVPKSPQPYKPLARVTVNSREMQQRITTGKYLQ